MSDAYSDAAINGQKLLSQMRLLRLQAALDEHEQIAEERARIGVVIQALKEMAVLSRELAVQARLLKEDATAMSDAVARARREIGR